MVLFALVFRIFSPLPALFDHVLVLTTGVLFLFLFSPDVPYGKCLPNEPETLFLNLFLHQIKVGFVGVELEIPQLKLVELEHSVALHILLDHQGRLLFVLPPCLRDQGEQSVPPVRLLDPACRVVPPLDQIQQKCPPDHHPSE